MKEKITYVQKRKKIEKIYKWIKKKQTERNEKEWNKETNKLHRERKTKGASFYEDWEHKQMND